ncbi:hypothetical protein GCM10010243_63060 [Streptomyces matensis]|nr:hypothetical protein GCM10010243_63060 [Streptomyces matensis]
MRKPCRRSSATGRRGGGGPPQHADRDRGQFLPYARVVQRLPRVPYRPHRTLVLADRPAGRLAETLRPPDGERGPHGRPDEPEQGPDAAADEAGESDQHPGDRQRV